MKAGDVINGRIVLDVKEIPDKPHLLLIFCKWGTQYVSWIFNKCFDDFNYGRYRDTYEEGLEAFRDHCKNYEVGEEYIYTLPGKVLKEGDIK